MGVCDCALYAAAQKAVNKRKILKHFIFCKNSLNLQLMAHELKIYKDRKTHEKIVEIHDLSFISDRNHKLGWFGLHYLHFRIKIMLKWADKVYVPDCNVAVDLVRYYFFPRQNIIVDRRILSPCSGL